MGVSVQATSRWFVASMVHTHTHTHTHSQSPQQLSSALQFPVCQGRLQVQATALPGMGLFQGAMCIAAGSHLTFSLACFLARGSSSFLSKECLPLEETETE